MKKPPFYKSLLYALKGIFGAIRERNFKIQSVALLLNLFLLIGLSVEKTDAAIMVMVCFMVLIAEGFNTALEKLCDFISPEYHLNIGFIKDLSAGMVLMSTLMAIIVGLLIYPKYF